MPDYISCVLQKLKYTPSSLPQYSPHRPMPFIYPQKGSRQYAPSPSNSPVLNATKTKWIQSAIGSILFYSRALDSTMLPTLHTLSTQQALPTKQTQQDVHCLLDYANTYKNTCLWFYASDMILHIDSDAAYLILPNACSQIAGYFHLLDKSQ